MIGPDDDELRIGDDGDADFSEPDCGLGPDGQCDQAGTEYCDWECGRLG